jgi:hypothetical protein
MVGKISHNDSLKATLAYNQKEGAELIITKNVLGDINKETGVPSIDDVYISLLHRVEYNDRVKKKVIHISLNPHPEDNIAKEQLKDIVEDYMREMAYENQPYAVFKHNDIDREHYHIVTTNIDSAGKRISDNFEKIKSQKILQQIERKYNLCLTGKNAKEGKKEKAAKEKQPYIPKPISNKDKDKVKKMRNTALFCIQNYRFQSLGEYNALLGLFNIDVQKEENSLLYSIKDSKGNKNTTPIKEAQLPDYMRSHYLNQLFNKNKKTPNTLKIHQTKAKVQRAMANTKGITALRKELKKDNIDLVLRSNNNRVYGATFIDHSNKLSINGSHLGKKFSANSIQHYVAIDPARPRFENIFSSPQGRGVANIRGTGNNNAYGGQDYREDKKKKKEKSVYDSGHSL